MNLKTESLYNRAAIHTILVVTPGADGGRSAADARRPWSIEIGNTGYVLDPTYSQYGYHTEIQPVADYVRTHISLTTRGGNFVRNFGASWAEHHKSLNNLNSLNLKTRYHELREEIYTQAMNRTLYQEIMKIGGRQKFFGIGHNSFLQYQERFVLAVRAAVIQAHDAADAVCSYYNNTVAVNMVLEHMLRDNFEHEEMIKALWKVRTG